MGFRFRKSIRLFPGVRVNLSKSVPSISVGEPGHTVNIGEHGTRATIGAPGTGLSYRTEPTRSRWPFWLLLVVVLAAIVLLLLFAGCAETSTIRPAATSKSEFEGAVYPGETVTISSNPGIDEEFRVFQQGATGIVSIQQFGPTQNYEPLIIASDRARR